MMKALIAKGANLNAPDDRGRTAADWAAEAGISIARSCCWRAERKLEIARHF
jgi:ankyrin repeat protein